MITLDDIRKKTRKLTASAFGITFNFEHRLCTMDREGEKRMRDLLILSEKVDKIAADEGFSAEEKYAQIEEIGGTQRHAFEEQVSMAVASWDFKVSKDSADTIPTDLESLRQYDIPLEIYSSVLRAIADNPLVPNPT